MGNYNCSVQTDEETLFKDTSFDLNASDTRVKRPIQYGLDAEPEVEDNSVQEPEITPVEVAPEQRAPITDHSPKYPEAEETLEMNYMTEKVNDTYHSKQRITKAEETDDYPDMGPYMYPQTGTTYQGQYHVGEKYGNGLEVYNNGGSYEGEFINDTKDGYGREIIGGNQHEINGRENAQKELIEEGYEEGDYYEGHWINGLRHGDGYETKNNGEMQYQGNWRNGKKNGRGKETISGANGHYKVLSTIMHDPANEQQDARSSRTSRYSHQEMEVDAVYDGTWKDNLKHGKGKWAWSDGSVYTGDFNQDNIEGYGEFQFYFFEIYA